ncbi:MAG TPA: RodZ domain-containing protein [Steroidobacteraceae bacterium]|nr:RodZ domain-containing protein [Steroidobacteraceae bacterium]
MAGESGGGSGADPRGQIGTRLKAARQRKKLSLLQAAEKLHVDLRVLEALEEEQFAELGAVVFVRGHIRHYAELVGESPAALLALYEESAQTVRAPDLTRVPSAETAGPSRSLLVPGIVVVMAVALIGGIWWVAGSLTPEPGPRSLQSSVPAAAPTAAAASPEPLATSAASGALPARASVSAAAAGAATAATAASAASATATEATHAADHPRVTEVTLHFAEDSWAEVYDAHGERLFYDIGAAGSVRPIRGSAPFRVVLGNAPGVALEINGHRVALPNAASDGSVDFQINRSGRVSASRLAAAQGHSP